MHENYVNSLQADIDKLKATLSTTTDPDKKSWCEDYIKALEEEKQECKYETCALCGGICDRCYYTEACERYNGTGTETPGDSSHSKCLSFEGKYIPQPML